MIPVTLLSKGRAITPVGEIFPYLDGVIVIPTFSIPTTYDAGCSRLVGWIPYEVSEQFCFQRFPTVTWPDTCCLCVKYRMDDRVFRYKLNTCGEVGLYYPMYSGEFLGPKFLIEIWQQNNVRASLATSMTLKTSIRRDAITKYTQQYTYLEDSANTYKEEHFNFDILLPFTNPTAEENNQMTLLSSDRGISLGYPLI